MATNEPQHEIGMIGLGVMGRNLLLNMADHGLTVAGYDKDLNQVNALRQEAKTDKVRGAESMEEFIKLLRPPRAVMMLVPAGPVVDNVIHDLLPHLTEGDIIIDGGNSNFHDTNVRQKAMAEKGIQFLGMGISGGEEGARHGPSIMPGGAREAYERVRPVLEAIAARVHGEPCVTYLGPGSAGHFVKMVHNGIEYGLMQLIAESYHLMKQAYGLNDDELHGVFADWNQGPMGGFLVEITASIFKQTDPETGKRLIDVILDVARQKGTGRWTSQSAMDLGIPVPSIDAAVTMRNLSALEADRHAAAKRLKAPDQTTTAKPDRAEALADLKAGFYAAMIITYAQGMSVLRAASEEYKYGLNLAKVACIWRGGCIIHAALLEQIAAAYRHHPELGNLMVDPALAKELVAGTEKLRSVICRATQAAVPVPGLMASLAYFDAYRSEWLPANLIQAQRDYFGAHTYERVDEKGVFHTQWGKAPET